MAHVTALGPGIQGRLQAAQVLAVQRVLARANWQKIADGRTARDVHPEAVADAGQAFAQLRSGTAATTHDGAWARPAGAGVRRWSGSWPSALRSRGVGRRLVSGAGAVGASGSPGCIR